MEDPRTTRALRTLRYMRQGNPPPFPPAGTPIPAWHSGKGTVAVLSLSTDGVFVIHDRISPRATLHDTATGKSWPLYLVNRKNPPLLVRHLVSLAHRFGLLWDEDIEILDAWTRREPPYTRRSLAASGADKTVL